MSDVIDRDSKKYIGILIIRIILRIIYSTSVYRVENLFLTRSTVDIYSVTFSGRT